MEAQTKEFPVQACQMLAGPVGVQLAAIPDDGGPAGRHRFSMLINTGKDMEHWFWEKLAIDLEGIDKPTKRVPALLNHDQLKRVGFSDPSSFRIDDEQGLVTEGELLKTNPHAKEIVQDTAEGFEFQASPYLQPMSIEQVEAGTEVEVNGRKFVGPGAIFRRSRILEVSFVAVGADDDTSTNVFARDGSTLSAQVFSQQTGEAMAEDTTPTEEEVENDAAEPQESQQEERTEESTEDVETPEPPADGGDAALARERERCSRIYDHAGRDQAKLAKRLVDGGIELGAALSMIDAAREDRKADRAQAFGRDSDESLNAGNADDSRSADPEPEPGSDEAIKLQWKKNEAALSAEFGDIDTFAAFERNRAAGRVKINGKAL